MSSYLAASTAVALLASTAPPCMAADPATPRTDAEVAAELANPLAPVTTFVVQARAEFDNGPGGDTNYQLRLQPSYFQPLGGKSALLVRSIVPLRKLNWPTDDSGLGDISLVPYYVPDITSSTFVGYGAALILPTASDKTLGGGKWSAGPAVLFAQTGQPLTWGGLVQQVWSFAGDGQRANVSVATIQPFVTYLLGGGWAVSLNSESSYNWNGAAGQRWLVPATLGVSKVVQFDGKFINLALAGVYNVERPTFAPRQELRFNATYVFK
jgi:hypothetical protein